MSALKLLTLLLMPTATALVAVVVALLLWRRRRRLSIALAIAGAAWLWLWATPFAADRITVALEAQYPLRLPQDLPTADAILVLGGDARRGQAACAAQPAHCSRTAFAAALYRARRAPWVLVSGGLADAQGRTEAARMRAQLIDMGVPDAAILVESGARNTRENISATAPLLRERGVRHLLLVTSAVHMPRAMANAGALNIELRAAPSDFDPAVGRQQGLAAALPQPAALRRSERALRERLGLLHQAVFGDPAP